jgi:glycine dehydrogenase subunit 2
MKDNQLIFEISQAGRIGFCLPNQKLPEIELEQMLPATLLRKEKAELPEVSELDIVRHYTKMSRLNFGVETGFYPLGSCTMKYNPKINEEIVSYDHFRHIHPLQDVSTVQPILAMIKDMESKLNEILGMTATSFNTFAGAHGELAGLMIIKAYHDKNKDYKRNKMIIPDSAHGTNPASAKMLGYECVTVKSNAQGIISSEALREVLDDTVAGIMLTNPNTLGLFEKEIINIAKLVHEAGGLLYYDGANLNPLLGVTRPGDMGFDIMHVNLHKTFSTPHGGGGLGSGSVSVNSKLIDLLPNPQLKNVHGLYRFVDNPVSCGRVGGFYGNFLVVIKAYAYLLSLGEKITNIGPLATLNANYVKERLKDYYRLPINGSCMHEFVFDGLIDTTTGVKTLDIAKRLLDYGMHAPTIYFPLLFEQSIMIEPTEVESKNTLDQFIDVMKKIAFEAINNPDLVKTAPHTTPVGRLDEVKAARQPILTYKELKKYV